MSYRKDSNEATRDATPQTMTVALVSFEPVPPPDAPPGIPKIQKLGQGLKGSFEVDCTRSQSGIRIQESSSMSTSVIYGDTNPKPWSTSNIHRMPEDIILLAVFSVS